MLELKRCDGCEGPQKLKCNALRANYQLEIFETASDSFTNPDPERSTSESAKNISSRFQTALVVLNCSLLIEEIEATAVGEAFEPAILAVQQYGNRSI